MVNDNYDGNCSGDDGGGSDEYSNSGDNEVKCGVGEDDAVVRGDER